MSFLGGPVSQARKPLAERLPDGRKRLTRYFKPTTTGTIPLELNFTPGTADPWTASTDGAPTGWTGLLSTYVQMRDSERGFPQGAEDDKPVVQVVFEQISASGETQTGGTPQTQLPSNRQQVEFSYVMFSSSTYTPQTPGSSTAPSPFTSYYLWEEKAEDDGTLRNIVRTYQTAGTVATDDESLQNGALLLKKIESFYTVPATPSGYTRIGTPVQNPNGYPSYTYTYAKGHGQVSQDDQTREGGALLIRTIEYLDVPSSSDPISTPSGYTIFDEHYVDRDGYRIWTASFAQGNGEVSRRFVDSEGGTTAFVPASPASSSKGAMRCIVTYLTPKSTTSNPTTGPSSFVFIGQEIEDRDGYRVWTVTYGFGTGLISELISSRNDGLREVTDISLGTRTAPSGIVIRDDYRNADGYIIYTVTSMQAADGGSATGATYSVERYVPFTYPGRAKPYAGSYGYFTTLDVFKGPPVTTPIKATVTISYQTTNTLGTISDFWNPKDWATINAQWVSFGYNPHNLIESLPGYRATTDTAVTAVCGTMAPINVTIFGNPVYGGTTASVQTTGGPVSPDGNTYTLAAEIDEKPAFTSTAGTNYYRKVLISATIPSQPALPV